MRKYSDGGTTDYSHYVTAVAALFNQQGDILILQRGSTAPWMPNVWSLVGGVVDEGENPDEAIVREIMEETGLQVLNLQYKQTKYTKDAGKIVYYAGMLPANFIVRLDYENQDFAFVNLSNIDQYGYVPHVKAYMRNLLEPPTAITKLAEGGIVKKYGFTEAEIDKWEKENKVSQRKTQNPVVKEAITEMAEGKLTQDEYLKILQENNPIKPFDRVPPLPTLKEIVVSLKTNQLEKQGIIGYTVEIPDGAYVASRLDIPAYDNYDVWVVSVHDGNKEKNVIGYGKTAYLKNVTFKSSPKTAMRIGMGLSSKSTFARMYGTWVNKSPEVVRNMAVRYINNPNWIQVGMNPYRHSWFYNKADGLPLVSADEVIQVGALVLAKNAVKTTVDDAEFIVDKKNPAIKYSDGGKTGSVYYRATSEDMGKQTVFTPVNKYEAFDDEGNPLTRGASDVFVLSDIPEVSASKTIGGAILGLWSMFNHNGINPVGKKIYIYEIMDRPRKDLSHVRMADFEYLKEVRYDKPVNGVRSGYFVFDTEFNNNALNFYERLNDDDPYSETQYDEDAWYEFEKYILTLNNNDIVKYADGGMVNNLIFSVENPEYEDAFFSRGDENEDTWLEYGKQSIQRTIDEVKGLKFPLTIYRGVPDEYLTNYDEIKGDYGGENRSWTTSKYVALEFSGDNGYIASKTIDESDIDYESTITRRIIHNALDEDEINLNDKGASKLTHIQKADSIFYDKGGKTETLLAPNGKPSNLSPEQWHLVRTPAFKAWFGDWENDPENASKVVDENGEPKICYHATPSSWNIAKIMQNDIGVHFGTKSQAEDRMRQQKIKNYIIIEAFLNAKYPIYSVDKKSWFGSNLAEILSKNKIEKSDIMKNELDILKAKYKYDETGKIVNNWSEKALIEWNDNNKKRLYSSKYDSIIYINKYEDKSNRDFSYILFHPTQIKLADGTNTTFDGSNPDIRYSNGGVFISKSRLSMPSVRGSWTKEKILRYLKSKPSDTISTYGLTYYISQFDSWEQLKDHIYYHGTTNYPEKGLKPSIVFSERFAEQMGGGGYGQRYWGISLTKRKRTAESFSGMYNHVTVYPVILKKDAKVIERTDLQDASEIEDIIVELYEQGVDAVWIGGGEEELVVVNPNSILLYKRGSDTYSVLGGFKSQALTDEQIIKIYDDSKKLWEEYSAKRNEIKDPKERSAYLQSLEPIKFSRGGKINIDDYMLVTYHEKAGNWAIFKNEIYLWLYDDMDAGNKLQSGEYDYVLFLPQPPIQMAFKKNYVPPLLQVWTKKYQNSLKGSEKLMAIIRAWYDETNHKLHILMMTTRNDLRKRGIISSMIKELRKKLNIEQEDVIFDDPTEEGKAVMESKKFDKGGKTETSRPYSNLDISRVKKGVVQLNSVHPKRITKIDDLPI